jgi:hypothetical protein
MMYTQLKSLEKLKQDISRFMASGLAPASAPGASGQ